MKRKNAEKDWEYPNSAGTTTETTATTNADVNNHCDICSFIGENENASNSHLNSEHKLVMCADIPPYDGAVHKAIPDLEEEQEQKEAEGRQETQECHSDSEPGKKGIKPSTRKNETDIGTRPKIIPAEGRHTLKW